MLTVFKMAPKNQGIWGGRNQYLEYRLQFFYLSVYLQNHIGSRLSTFNFKYKTCIRLRNIQLQSL